jgi:FMN phosphatase YigB (HAD superfamily)
MLNICFDKIVAFDVDDTLVYQTPPKHYSFNADFVLQWKNEKIPMWIHKEHVAKLKELKNQGCGIIVWSQQGNEWADAVVIALGLFNYVDFAITKPKECYDDLPFRYWTTRKFIGNPNE